MTRPIVPHDLILSANLLVGRKPAKVKTAARRHLAEVRPLVATFQEAGGYLPQLRALSVELGYSHPIAAAEKAGRGMNSNVLVVRADVPITTCGVAKVRVPWIGPRLGIHWPGRAFPWAVVYLDGVYTLVVDVHMPTAGRGLNRLAWAACKRRLRRLSRRLVVRGVAEAFVFVGDWNQRHDDDGPGSIRRMANKLDAQVVTAGTPIDYAVVRGIALDGRRGPARGSDHPSTIYRRKPNVKEAQPGR